MTKFHSSLALLVLIIGLVVSIASAADLLDGLVGYWPMNSTAKDGVGSNHGTFEGGARIVADGQRDMVLSLDGEDDYVSIPDSADFDIVGDFMVSFWMKLSSNFDSSSAASMPPIGKYGSGDYQMIFTLIGSEYGVGAEGMDNLLTGGMAFKVEDKSDGNSFLYVGSLIDAALEMLLSIHESERAGNSRVDFPMQNKDISVLVRDPGFISSAVPAT